MTTWHVAVLAIGEAPQPVSEIEIMFVLPRRTRIAAACGILAMLPAIAQAQTSGDDKTLAAALRGGGLVILVRHGATFTNQADTDPLNLDNIAKQRNLNDNGKA